MTVFCLTSIHLPVHVDVEGISSIAAKFNISLALIICFAQISHENQIPTKNNASTAQFFKRTFYLIKITLCFMKYSTPLIATDKFQ